LSNKLELVERIIIDKGNISEVSVIELMITLIGWGLFNQKLDLPAIVGILLIVSGVIVMYGLSDSVAH